MIVDQALVRRLAELARLELSADEVATTSRGPPSRSAMPSRRLRAPPRAASRYRASWTRP